MKEVSERLLGGRVPNMSRCIIIVDDNRQQRPLHLLRSKEMAENGTAIADEERR
jgi:hypothetical protein